MKALFIWNDTSKDFLIRSLSHTKQFSDVIEDFGIKEEFLLSSEEDWLKHNNTINKVQNIFILVELGWDRDIFKGYKIGLEILRKWKGQKPPTIQFVSMMPRQLLFNNVSGKEQYLVKVFNHLDLFDTYNEKFQTFYTDIDEWNFYKNYALTGAGILDDFSHRLTTIISLKEKKGELSTIISQMENQSNLLGERVMNHLSIFEESELDLKTFAIKLRQLIDERIFVYGSHKSDGPKISNNLKVMIVEDNERHRDILKASLSEYFSEDRIRCFSKGQEAIAAYEENPKDYNLIFIDLELLEGSFYQPIQGLHILKKIRDKKMSSFTVITGLGRKGVQELLQIPIKKIVSKKQLYQYDTDKEVEGILKRMVREFSILEKEILVEVGPKKSYFNWEGFRTIFSEYYLDPDFVCKSFKDAKQVLECFKKRTLTTKDWPNENKELISPKQKTIAKYSEFIAKKFSTLLAHRYVIIYLASLNDFTLYCDNEYYEIYADTLEENNICLNRGYLDRICFNYKGLRNGLVEKYKIEKINLFPKEIKLIAELEKEKKKGYASTYLVDNSTKLFNLCEKYLDLEQEQAQRFDVPAEVKSWTIQDMITVIEGVFLDTNSKGKESSWYFTIESLVCSSDYKQAEELELKHYIPNIESLIKDFFDLPD